MKTKIIMKPANILVDYGGMNYYAAKEIGFHLRPKKNEIFIEKGMSQKVIKQTIKHEEVERRYMEKGYSYWAAHKKALKAEKKVR